MSEKRFTLFGLDNETIKDDVTKECYWVNEYVQRKKLVDLLNEQQATIFKLQEIIIDLKDDKNQLHKVISKLRQEVAEMQTRNAVLSSKLNQIPKNIKEVWLE